MRAQLRRGFTLIEILVVVVILGILAVAVVPQFASATDDASFTTTQSELTKIRRAIDIYHARNNQWPNITAGNATWGPLVGTGEYLRSGPLNPWVGTASNDVIVLGNAPDAAYQTVHAWIYDPATGSIWAGSFDANDEPHPRP